MFRPVRHALWAALLALSCGATGCTVQHLVALEGNESDASAGGAGGMGGMGGMGGTGAFVFGPPSVVMGLRSPTDDLQDPTLTSDELEIFFLSVTNGMSDIWKSQRASTTAPWGTASMVSELSSPAQDLNPSLSRDGLTIYFSSDRGADVAVFGLWVSRRSARDQPWGPPEQILSLGTSPLDMAASVDASNLRMVFSSERDNMNLHLFASTRADPSAAWGPAESLTTVNSDWQDRDPCVFNQGNDLVFASRRTAQGRTSDLFHIARPDPTAPFGGVAVPLTELNSDAWEGDPWLSEDGRHILFVSDRTGTPRIYEARR